MSITTAPRQTSAAEASESMARLKAAPLTVLSLPGPSGDGYNSLD